MQSVCALLDENLAKAPMPLTLVATSGPDPVGTVSILAHDVGTERWAVLSPWLAALYVVPHARGQGIGADLVSAALAGATAFAAGSVYLLTTGHEAFYARLGWKVMDRYDDAVVMVRPVGATGSPR